MRLMAEDIIKFHVLCVLLCYTVALTQDKFTVKNGVNLNLTPLETITTRSKLKCASDRSANAKRTNKKWQCFLNEDATDLDVNSTEVLSGNDYAYIAVINECDSHPCMNGAACSNLVNGYSCACTTGYEGLHCETDIDECAGIPCANGGLCNDQVNGYICDCDAGYTGATCESKQYLVNINTGSATDSLSSSRFYMTLQGDSEGCNEVQLPTPLSPSSVPTSTPTCPVSMGALTSVTLRIHSEDRDGWLLNKLIITDNLLAMSYTLTCYCWLDTDTYPSSESVASVTLTV